MRLSLSIFFSCVLWVSYAQKNADKSFYLVDSLDLENVSIEDKKYIDSCLNVYHQSTNDTVQIHSLATIVENTWNDDVWPKYNDLVYSMVKEQARNIKDKKRKRFYQFHLSQVLNNKGYYYNEVKFNPDLALKYYLMSLKVLRQLKDKENIPSILINLGTVYEYKGDYIKALEYYHKALNKLAKIGDKETEAITYNSIGNVYENLNDYKKALEYYKKGLLIFEKIKNQYSIATSYGNMGNVLLSLHRYDEALEYYMKANQIFKNIKDLGGIATTTSQVSRCYFFKKEYDKALKLSMKALKIREEIKDVRGLSFTNVAIGEIYLAQKKINQAEEYIKKGYKIAVEHRLKHLILNSSKLLSKVYELQNKPKEALNLYKVYNQMRDSIYDNTLYKKKIEQQVKYEFEKKQQLYDARVKQQQQVYNSKYNEQLAKEKHQKEKQTLISYFIGISLFIGALFLIFILNRLRISREHTEIIATQKEEVEKQKQIIEDTHIDIQDSIKYAKHLQDAILPPIEEIKAHFSDVFVLFKPKDIVSGDFSWFEYKNGVKYVAVADCTGHGVPGAMISVVCANALDRAINQFQLSRPSEILEKTRKIVVHTLSKGEKQLKDGMDIVLCAFEGDSLLYSGAFNPLWVVRKTENINITDINNCRTIASKDGKLTLIEFKGTRQSVGFSYNKDSIPFKEYNIKLYASDSIYLATDGYADQFGWEHRKKFKQLTLKNLLLSIHDLDMDEQKFVLNDVFETWKGNHFQLDDVCIMGIKI